MVASTVKASTAQASDGSISAWMQVNGNAEDSILWLAQEREFGDMDTLRVDCYLEEAMFNLLAKLEVDTG